MYTGATLVKCFKFLKVSMIQSAVGEEPFWINIFSLQNFHQEKINEALKMCQTEQEKNKVLETMSKTKYAL